MQNKCQSSEFLVAISRLGGILNKHFVFLQAGIFENQLVSILAWA